MTDPLTYITEGSRVFATRLKNQIHYKKYSGNAKEICQQVVQDCWNKSYFQTSTSSFPQFWSRDFGWCTSSLMKLGYKDKVHHTLRYALNNFKLHNQITTTITPTGKPYDYPTYAVDSLPWLIHSILVSKFPYHSFIPFLNKEIQRFFDIVINQHTGLVKPEVHFSSMKDLSVRKSSCYDNCMVGLLAKDLAQMKLINPLAKFDYPSLIERHFWNGKYFYDDLTKQEYVAGDANVFPFIFGLITDKEKLAAAIKSIKDAGLDQPFPLKYTAERKMVKFVWQERLALRNYESNSVWMHMGPLYVKLVQQYDRELAKEYKEKYTELIERMKTFPEVLNANGKPYQSWFHYCSPGMLWAANYLTL